MCLCVCCCYYHYLYHYHYHQHILLLTFLSQFFFSHFNIKQCISNSWWPALSHKNVSHIINNTQCPDLRVVSVDLSDLKLAITTGNWCLTTHYLKHQLQEEKEKDINWINWHGTYLYINTHTVCVCVSFVVSLFCCTFSVKGWNKLSQIGKQRRRIK